MENNKESAREIVEFCEKYEKYKEDEKPSLPDDFERFIVSVKAVDKSDNILTKIYAPFSALAVLVSIFALIAKYAVKEETFNTAIFIGAIIILALVIIYLILMIYKMRSSKNKKKYEYNYYFIGNSRTPNK